MCLEYSVFRRLKGERRSVDCSQVRNYQSTPAPVVLQEDVRQARKHLAGVPVFVAQRQNSWHSCRALKSVVLCSQVSSLCRASLWNNLFTLAATQYGHNQSRHQSTVQTQAEELYSYENHGNAFRAPVLNARHSVEQILWNFSECKQRRIASDIAQWTSICLVRGEMHST